MQLSSAAAVGLEYNFNPTRKRKKKSGVKAITIIIIFSYVMKRYATQLGLGRSFGLLSANERPGVVVRELQSRKKQQREKRMTIIGSGGVCTFRMDDGVVVDHDLRASWLTGRG